MSYREPTQGGFAATVIGLNRVLWKDVPEWFANRPLALKSKRKGWHGSAKVTVFLQDRLSGGYLQTFDGVHP